MECSQCRVDQFVSVGVPPVDRRFADARARRDLFNREAFDTTVSDHCEGRRDDRGIDFFAALPGHSETVKGPSKSETEWVTPTQCDLTRVLEPSNGPRSIVMPMQ